MMDYRQLPPPPEQAARDSWDVFGQLYPQRVAPWDELAEWERDRWRIITSAARQAQQISDITDGADEVLARLGRMPGRPPS